jgi:hypothetical protein
LGDVLCAFGARTSGADRQFWAVAQPVTALGAKYRVRLVIVLAPIVELDAASPARNPRDVE